MHSTQRVTLGQRALVVGQCGDLVLADEGVTPDQCGWPNGLTPYRFGGVFRIRPQRVGITVALGYVPECVFIGAEVVRRLGMWDGDADGGAQSGQPLVGDLAGLHHPAPLLAARSVVGSIVEIKIPEKRKRR